LTANQQRLSQIEFKEIPMLRLAIVFLVIALIAGFFGYAGVASLSFQGAQLLFFIFLVLAVLFFLGNFLRGSPPRDII
jgi:uncharacterized membrane protein YtjA (UPF0391 family)